MSPKGGEISSRLGQLFWRLKVTSVMCGGVVRKPKISVKMLEQIAESTLQKLHAKENADYKSRIQALDFGSQK